MKELLIASIRMDDFREWVGFFSIGGMLILVFCVILDQLLKGLFVDIPRIILSRKLDKLNIKSSEFKLKLVLAGKESDISNPYEAMIEKVNASIMKLKETETSICKSTNFFIGVLEGLFCLICVCKFISLF